MFLHFYLFIVFLAFFPFSTFFRIFPLLQIVGIFSCFKFFLIFPNFLNILLAFLQFFINFIYFLTFFRPCEPGHGVVQGPGQDGGHRYHPGGRGGRHWGRLPEVCCCHQRAFKPHEKPGKNLPLFGVKNVGGFSPSSLQYTGNATAYFDKLKFKLFIILMSSLCYL